MNYTILIRGLFMYLTSNPCGGIHIVYSNDIVDLVGKDMLSLNFGFADIWLYM